MKRYFNAATADANFFEPRHGGKDKKQHHDTQEDVIQRKDLRKIENIC